MFHFSNNYLLLLLLLCCITIHAAENTLQFNLTETRISYCQSSPNIDVSDSQRQSAWESINSKYDDTIYKQIEPWIQNGFTITSDEYFSQFETYSVPWLIIALISFILQFIYLYVTCRPKAISDWIKTHAEEEFVKTAKKLNKIGIISVVILNITIIVCCILAMVYSNHMMDGLEYSKCKMSQAFDNLQNQNDDTFTGYAILQSDLSSIVNHFSEFQADLKLVYSSRQSVKLAKEQTNLIAFNNQFKRNQKKSPLPIQISSNGTNVVPTTESYFSKMKIFDYILSNTQEQDYLTFAEYYQLMKAREPDLYLIDQVDTINAYYDLIFSRLGSLENSSFALRDAKLINIFSKAKAQITSNNGYLLDYSEQYLNFHKNLNEMIDKSQQVVKGLAIPLVILCFTQVILWVGFFLNQRLKIKKIVDCSWFLCNLLLIAFLIVNIFIHSNSSLSNQICIYFDGFTNNQVIYKQQNIFKNSDTKLMVQQCLYDDGNIFEQLNLTTRVNDIRTYINSNNGLNDQISKMNANQAVFLQLMNNNSQGISSLMDGTFIDLTDEQLTSFNKVITNFNNLKTTQDCVEFANKKCADGSSPIKATDSSVNSTCWHPSYLITKLKANCDQQQSDFQQLKQHFSAQTQGWIQAQIKESQIVTANSDLNFELKSYISQIETLKKNNSATIASMSNLLKSDNCTFIKEQFNQMLDGMCVEYSTSITKVASLIIIIICTLFISILINCLTSFKVSQMDSYEEYASTKVIHLVGSGKFRRQPEQDTQMQPIYGESPQNFTSKKQEFS